MKEIDARGLACPAPVLQTKTVLEENNPDAVKVILDSAAAQQNVQRFLESKGFEAALSTDGADYLVVGKCGTPSSEPIETRQEDPESTGKVMVMCATDRIGSGDDTLGAKLMANFIRTLKEMGPDLWRLVFVNNGVKLTIEGSEVLEDLKTYEASGTGILVCGTCLDHFNLLDKKQVGDTTNMLDIITAMQLADKVINL